jgi:serpin B
MLIVVILLAGCGEVEPTSSTATSEKTTEAPLDAATTENSGHPNLAEKSANTPAANQQPTTVVTGAETAAGESKNEPEENTPIILPVTAEEPAKEPDKGASDSSTHRLVAKAVYYEGGPQQGRPPDGHFAAGTRVTLIRDAGSYALVRSDGGVEAYVATDVLHPLDVKETPIMNPNVAPLVQGNNQFALDLFAQLRAQTAGNLFVSPYSLSTALAMTFAGARGETEREMARVLHFSLDQTSLHSAYSSLSGALSLGRGDDSERLSVANRLWGQEGYGFLAPYLETTRQHYRAELAEVNFAQESESARQTINSWVEAETAGKIHELIPEGMLGPLTRLVLTNAIYFKGQWKEPFREKQTAEAAFHVSDDKTSDIPLMRRQDDFRYTETGSVQVLEMPYAEGDLAMAVLLPRQADGLADLERSLTAETLSGWLETLRRREVNVFLPRFRMTSEFELTNVLQAMGMAQAFSPGGADFSGMSTSEDLYLSAVVHKASVDVNEEGTEAAAATGIEFAATALPVAKPVPVFRADHPFLFLIRDRKTKSILFLGRVTDPAES